jgi:predicted nucleic acid-binding protein
MATSAVEVIPGDHEMFLAGISLYDARDDKSYSLTDCISMNVIHDRGINDVLTQDSILLRKVSISCSDGIDVGLQIRY